MNSPSRKKVYSASARSKKTYRVPSHEAGVVTETSLKLFFSLFVGLVATISLVRLLPYHFAQSGKLRELRTQVKETEQRVIGKREQLRQNFDFGEDQVLMEQHSPKISKDRVRLFWLKDEKP